MCRPLLVFERGLAGSIGRAGGAAPDPSTLFALLCLYIFEHPTFHSAQDDEIRRGVLKYAVFTKDGKSVNLLNLQNLFNL